MRRWIFLSIGLMALAGCKSSSSDGGEGGSASGDTGTESNDGSTGDGSDSGDGEGTDEEESGGLPKLDVGDDDGGDDGGLPDLEPPPFPKTCEEAETSKTSVGCTFYPLNVPGAGGTSAAFIVSNVSEAPASVTLSDRNGELSQAVVQPGALHTFNGAAHDIVMDPQSGPWTGVFDKGYVIESDQVLQVWTFMPTSPAATNDASIIFPESTLGQKHRVVTYQDKFTSASVPTHYMAVVAVEDDTEVTFTLAQDGSYTDAGGGISPLDKDNGPASTTVNLDRLQVAVVTGWNKNPNTMAFDNDFTGSLVEADKPIVVYSGNYCSFAPDCGTTECCCCDLITDAVPPTTVYGTEMAAVRLVPVGDKKDIWRFIGNRDGTEVTLTGELEDVIQLDAGEFADIVTGEVFWASSSHPVGLVHFMTGGSTAGLENSPYEFYDCPEGLQSPGDPAITWVYPWGNWLNRYQFPVGDTVVGEWCNDHITVVASMEGWDQIQLNGDALPAPTQIAETGVGWAYVQVPDGDYEIVAPEDVGVEVSVYGFSNHGSYLYPGGMGLQELNPEG